MLPCGGMYGGFSFCGFLVGCGFGWWSMWGVFGSDCVGSWWAMGSGGRHFGVGLVVILGWVWSC